MKQTFKHIRWAGVGLVVLLGLSGCMMEKSDARQESRDPDEGFYDGSGTMLATGTYRIQEGAPTIRIDTETLAYVVNPDPLSGVADCTRIMLEYTPVNREHPDFCTESAYLQWVSVLDEGVVSLVTFEENYSTDAFGRTDPVIILQDWITSLEDGFLTLHYTIAASGEKKHFFSLQRSWEPGSVFYLVHDAQGDPGTRLMEGIVCFRIGNLTPGEDGKITLSLKYLNENKTLTTLTFDYPNPA
jgi:hypothetical protein